MFVVQYPTEFCVHVQYHHVQLILQTRFQFSIVYRLYGGGNWQKMSRFVFLTDIVNVLHISSWRLSRRCDGQKVIDASTETCGAISELALLQYCNAQVDVWMVIGIATKTSHEMQSFAHFTTRQNHMV